MTANPAGAGTYKAGTLEAHAHDAWERVSSSVGSGTGRILSPGTASAPVPTLSSDSIEITGTAETAPAHSRVAALILI